MVKIDSEWHIIYTKPGSERKVASSLRKKNIEHYYPLTQVHPGPRNSNKTFVEPLLISHLFVKILKQQFTQVRKTNDVINFLYWLNKPVVIKECDIDSIKEFLNERINVRLEKIPVTSGANAATTEKIVDGEATVAGVLNKSPRLTLPYLGYAMVSDEYRSQVEELQVFKTKYRPLEKLLLRVSING